MAGLCVIFIFFSFGSMLVWSAVIDDEYMHFKLGEICGFFKCIALLYLNTLFVILCIAIKRHYTHNAKCN